MDWVITVRDADNSLLAVRGFANPFSQQHEIVKLLRQLKIQRLLTHQNVSLNHTYLYSYVLNFSLELTTDIRDLNVI